MKSIIKSKIIDIGNSQGVRLPKTVLAQSGLKHQVEIEASEGKIIIRTIAHPRSGWAPSFKQMAALGDDTLLDEAAKHDWDKAEWEWV